LDYIEFRTGDYKVQDLGREPKVVPKPKGRAGNLAKKQKSYRGTKTLLCNPGSPK